MGSKTRDSGDGSVTAEWDGPTGESPRRSNEVQGSYRRTPHEDRDLSKDKLFKVLGNRRRRCVLHYLAWCDRPVTLDELADRIASWENATSVDSVGSKERKRVYTALQQFHLPKLAEASLIEYDERAGVIERTAIADDLEGYLDLVPANDIPWSYYYLGAALVGLLLTGCSAAGLPFFALFSPLAWASTFLLIVLGSSIAHAFTDRRYRLGGGVHPPDLDRE